MTPDLFMLDDDVMPPTAVAVSVGFSMRDDDEPVRELSDQESRAAVGVAFAAALDPMTAAEQAAYDSRSAGPVGAWAGATAAAADHAAAAARGGLLTSPAALAATPLMQILPADFPLPALTRFVPDAALRAALVDATATAAGLEVKGVDGLALGDGALEKLTAAIKAVEANYEEPIEIANKLHKTLTGGRAEVVKPAAEAKTGLGRRIWLETERLKKEAAEAQRLEQEKADQAARADAARELEAAKKQGAGADVVAELEREVKTATAPPVQVAASSQLAAALKGNTPITTWKARPIGTSDDAEPNPEMGDLDDAQWASIAKLLVDVAAGKMSRKCVAIDWKHLNKLAGAEEKTLAITGIEAFKTGGTRAKSTRAKK